MYIERIEIEGGFLDGLQLDLAPGLNVIIGARGTGKSSLIELVRYCVNADSFTERTRLQANQHARAVLGSGRVTVYLRHHEDRITVSRSADDEQPRSTGLFTPVTVLAQNEIETVGTDIAGRLRLVDTFINEADRVLEVQRILSDLSSRTAEIQGVLTEISDLERLSTELVSVPDMLKAVVEEQQTLLASVKSSQPDRILLAQLQAKSAEYVVRLDVIGRTKKAIQAAEEKIASSQATLPAIELWPTVAGGPDQLEKVRSKVEEAAHASGRVLELLGDALDELLHLEEQTSQERNMNDVSMRPIRQRLEQLQAGAGAIAHQVEALREKEGQLSALTQAAQASRARIGTLADSRRSTFDTLEEHRGERLARRMGIVDWLNTELGPVIKVSVTGSGYLQPYITAIAESLQGSGLHYNSLAPLIAETMSPLEFVEAIENNDLNSIVNATGLSLDRVVSVSTYLGGRDISKIIMSEIDDSVALSLLDGKEYKQSNELSIGQRCTVVLPILLNRHQDVLIVDQPEDHLDNSFITNTLVPSLLRRTNDEQLIFSSHNPNIPVLGNANKVILMESDGRRGFIRHAGELDDTETVNAVTSVMEGGREAFLKRAKFYSSVFGG